MLVLIAILLPFLMKPTVSKITVCFSVEFGFLTPGPSTPSQVLSNPSFPSLVYPGNREHEGHHRSPASPELAAPLSHYPLIHQPSTLSSSPSPSPSLPHLMTCRTVNFRVLSLSSRGSAHPVTVPQFYCGHCYPCWPPREPDRQAGQVSGAATHNSPLILWTCPASMYPSHQQSLCPLSCPRGPDPQTNGTNLLWNNWCARHFKSFPCISSLIFTMLLKGMNAEKGSDLHKLSSENVI